MNTQLGILDLSDPSGLDLEAAACQFKQSTKQSGFIYVRINESTETVVNALREQQRHFFSQTLARKRQVAIDRNNRGYLESGMAMMPGASRHDQKEVFFWGREMAHDDPDLVAGVALCGPNQWPDNMPELRSAVIAYSKFIRALGDTLLRIIARSLGASDDFFSPFYRRPMLRGQLLRYPTTENLDDQFGVAAHSDFGCITLLLQERPGLEVLFPDGQWIAAPPIDHTLVINIGDLLERWSNGRLPSTKHRVKNQAHDDRYSIAMFYDPSPTAIVDPQDLLPRETRRFDPISAADYILSKNKQSFEHYKAS